MTNYTIGRDAIIFAVVFISMFVVLAVLPGIWYATKHKTMSHFITHYYPLAVFLALIAAIGATSDSLRVKLTLWLFFTATCFISAAFLWGGFGAIRAFRRFKGIFKRNSA